MENELKLFTVTHKEVTGIPDDRIMIGVGNRKISNVVFYDNVGDNISEKNANYCELTALYWIWKNVTAEYIGLEHYRRFFYSKNCFKAKPMSERQLLKKMGKYEVVLPVKENFKCSVYEHFKKLHYINDLEICRQLIALKYPEYLKDFDFIMSERHISVCNMFVMPKPLMDEYCEWLFGILFEAEKKIDLSGRDAYQSRVFGFLSERLFNVWLKHKNLKCYYTSVYNVGDSPIKIKIKSFFTKVKNRLKK